MDIHVKIRNVVMASRRLVWQLLRIWMEKSALA